MAVRNIILQWESSVEGEERKSVHESDSRESSAKPAQNHLWKHSSPRKASAPAKMTNLTMASEIQPKPKVAPHRRVGVTKCDLFIESVPEVPAYETVQNKAPRRVKVVKTEVTPSDICKPLKPPKPPKKPKPSRTQSCVIEASDRSDDLEHVLDDYDVVPSSGDSYDVKYDDCVTDFVNTKRQKDEEDEEEDEEEEEEEESSWQSPVLNLLEKNDLFPDHESADSWSLHDGDYEVESYSNSSDDVPSSSRLLKKSTSEPDLGSNPPERMVSYNWHKSHIKKTARALQNYTEPKTTIARKQLLEFIHQHRPHDFKARSQVQLQHISEYFRKPMMAMKQKRMSVPSIQESFVQPFNRVIGMMKNGRKHSGSEPQDHLNHHHNDVSDDDGWGSEEFSDGSSSGDDDEAYIEPVSGGQGPPQVVNAGVPSPAGRPPVPIANLANRPPPMPPGRIPAQNDASSPPPRPPRTVAPSGRAPPPPTKKMSDIKIAPPKNISDSKDGEYIIPEDRRGMEPVYDPVDDSVRPSLPCLPSQPPPLPPGRDRVKQTQSDTDENQNTRAGVSALAGRFNISEASPPQTKRPGIAAKPKTNGKVAPPRDLQERLGQQIAAAVQGRRPSEDWTQSPADAAPVTPHRPNPPPPRTMPQPPPPRETPDLKNRAQPQPPLPDLFRPQPQPPVPRVSNNIQTRPKLPTPTDRVDHPLGFDPQRRGSDISSARPLPPPPLKDEEESLYSYDWYFGDISREQVEQKLLDIAVDGTFLVRKSQGGQGNPYTLQFYDQGKIWRLQVKLRADNKYALGNHKPNEPTFRSVPDLVQHFRNNPVGACRGDTRMKSECVLTTPPPH